MKRSLIGLALTSMLLVMSIAPAQASTAGTYSGKWRGKTSQGESIKFKVNSGDVVNYLKVTYSIPQCGVTATTTLRNQKAAIKSGKFTVKSSFGTGSSLTVKGQMVSANKAKGTLNAYFSDPVYGCSAGVKTKWSAKR